MSLSAEDVAHVARLARLNVDEGDLVCFVPQLNGILAWIEQLGEVDTGNVEPMSTVGDLTLPLRKDEVSDGGIQQDVLANAPESAEGYYVVQKIIE